MASSAKGDSRTTELHNRIRAARVGAYVNLGKVVPAGTLLCRRLASGAEIFYWRFTQDGKSDRVPIGPYSTAVPPKTLKPIDGRYSILAAERAAQDLAARHHAARGDGGHRALAARDKAAKETANRQRGEAAAHTLRALLNAYCDHQVALKRADVRDARSIFKLHVFDAWPAIADAPAAEVTEEQVADMLRSLFELGKERTANKLRAYLRAAYELPRRARTDPKVPMAFKSYAIRTNPAAATAPNTSANKADKNPLTADELRAYWGALVEVPGFKGAVLRLHLLTGGQRLAQFVRLKSADIGADTITLYDGKGRPGKGPRKHALPLIEQAAEALRACHPRGEYGVSATAGETPLRSETLSRWAAEVAQTVPIKDFEAKRIRSGVETLLASAAISREIRGRLQSHGVGGVQDTHYDAHDYMPEKRRALEVLYEKLTQPAASNVVALRTA